MGAFLNMDRMFLYTVNDKRRKGNGIWLLKFG